MRRSRRVSIHPGTGCYRLLHSQRIEINRFTRLRLLKLDEHCNRRSHSSLMKFLALLAFVLAAVDGMDPHAIGQRLAVNSVEYPSQRTYTRVILQL
jgi:hypothetical protein